MQNDFFSWFLVAPQPFWSCKVLATQTLAPPVLSHVTSKDGIAGGFLTSVQWVSSAKTLVQRSSSRLCPSCLSCRLSGTVHPFLVQWFWQKIISMWRWFLWLSMCETLWLQKNARIARCKSCYDEQMTWDGHDSDLPADMEFLQSPQSRHGRLSQTVAKFGWFGASGSKPIRGGKKNGPNRKIASLRDLWEKPGQFSDWRKCLPLRVALLPSHEWKRTFARCFRGWSRIFPTCIRNVFLIIKDIGTYEYLIL